MASDDSHAPDPKIPRGHQFTLRAILVFTAIVAVIVATATGAFGEEVSKFAVGLAITALFPTVVLLVVAYVLWPLALFIYRVESSTFRRRRRAPQRNSSPDSSQANSAST